MNKIDSGLYRDFFANTAGSIYVVTTSGSLGCFGITMTAVVSVTDNPPTLLICVNQEAKIHDILLEHELLSINVLTAKQQNVADDFAGLTPVDFADRFKNHRYQLSKNYAQPHLDGSIAYIDGKIISHTLVGTHSIFLIEVKDVAINDSKQDVLVYFRRAYCSVSAATENSKNESN